jgi:transposase-like protein
MMYVRYPLSLRNVEDLLAERGIDISHETVRYWWNRFGPMFAAEIRANDESRTCAAILNGVGIWMRVCRESTNSNGGAELHRR